MDSPAHNLAHSGRDRSFVSQSSRAPSRASNSTTSTRITSHSTGNSSYTTSSPKMSSSTLSSHRLNLSNGGRKPVPSHLSSQLMREVGYDARQSPVSSYLQEKLQRERKVESDNKSVSSGRTSNDPNVQSSPIRREGFDPRRPMSSGGHDSSSKKKGMGVKEMEQIDPATKITNTTYQTVSTLHKQNFDLKLELYHRRERQTALEEELVTMKEEKNQFMELNDRLVEELEKRDKAVEEAVAMIVLLEAQVETLLKEREMVRHIESQTAFGGMNDPLDIARGTTPKPLSGHVPRASVDLALQRMPSFLSEQSETTENLRNVYLCAKGGSLLSLLRPTETPLDLEHERLASPSLSVLSESSFVSVYGKNSHQDGDNTVTPFDETPSLDIQSPDGASLNRSQNALVRERYSRDRVGTPSRSMRTNPLTQAAQYQPLADLLDQASPLQRLEKMDRTFSLKTVSSRQSGQEREPEYQKAAPAPPPVSRTESQRRTKEEKREALRRVMTDGPAGRLRDQNMPPTPDTISTTTLRHYQNSADALSSQPGLAHQQSYFTLSETNSLPSLDARPDQRAQTVIPASVSVAQPPSMTAFNSRKDVPTSSYFDSRPPIIQRPRSADETTASHRKNNGWDSESDDESDINSMASSLDIWMKDSWKPSKSSANGRRYSPDLFGFPSKGATSLTSPWSPDAMLNSVYAKPSKAGGVSINGGLDDLIPVEAALFGSGVPPPPPHRRSSLHAQTGSTSASAMLEAMNRSEASGRRWGRKSGPGKRGHARRNSDDATSMVSQPDPQQDVQAADGKGARNNHYPPITGQQSRNRGLNRFFRRSIGSASCTESAPPSAPEPTFPAGTSAPKSAGIGIPSWIHRSSIVDDERSGATPPPIMRNRALSKGEADDEDRYEGGAPVGGPPVDDGAASGGATPTSKGPTNGDAATRRKWLPAFGRSVSQRARN
ncbi:hypothetical protein jhhlp_000409 [Lomentospora prolificans]|uniref:Centrosomin N-terminal motif 1 domain-containing protein n=1 Tax=Lomentospora prolificans TaxID=41688 RepID=A0A2N3NKY3_9PEZI|nr:hypothetical protein jhhlp_000409 [Lomentospora prolificans]